MLQAAGDFRPMAKPCCILQGTSATWRNRAASYRRLPPLGKTVLQAAGDFRPMAKP